MDSAPTTTDERPFSVVAWFAIGAAGAAVGLLPWLVTGARLPLQNLAADQSTTATPFALLPFSQYFLSSIVALVVVGAAITGLTSRALARRRPRSGTTASVSGMLVVQLLAAVQATVVTVGSLEQSRRTVIYVGAVVAVIVVSVVVGLLVLLLVARSPVPGAAIGLSLAAVVSARWLDTALQEVMMSGAGGPVQVILLVLRWIPAVLGGCVIAWCGFQTVGRIAAVLVGLAASWIGAAFFIAVSSAAGTRVLAPYPAEMADYGRQVFLSALTTPALVVPPLVVAVIIGITGAMISSRIRIRSRPRTGARTGTGSRARDTERAAAPSE